MRLGSMTRIPVLVLGALVLASGSAAHAGDPSGPPFEDATIVVEISWDDQADLALSYVATASPDPIGDPYGEGEYVAGGGGCEPGAVAYDEPNALVLRDPGETGTRPPATSSIRTSF